MLLSSQHCLLWAHFKYSSRGFCKVEVEHIRQVGFSQVVVFHAHLEAGAAEQTFLQGTGEGAAYSRKCGSCRLR